MGKPRKRASARTPFEEIVQRLATIEQLLVRLEGARAGPADDPLLPTLSAELGAAIAAGDLAQVQALKDRIDAQMAPLAAPAPTP